MIHAEAGIRRLEQSRANGIDRSFSANPATGSGKEVAGHLFKVGRNFRCDLHLNDIRRIHARAFRRIFKRENVLAALDDAFCKQKTGCQLEIMARGAHGDTQRTIADADFQRFFRCEEITLAVATTVVPLGDLRKI